MQPSLHQTFCYLLIAFWHFAASAVVQGIEVVELLLILLFQLRTYHACHIAGALHDHDLTDAVVLTLQEAVVRQRQVVVEIL